MNRGKITDRGGARISIVVPTLNEAASLPGLLADLAGLSTEREVVVADGGSEDGTREVAAAAGARVIEAPRGRGRQLREGARAAGAPLLAFLHADVRLDKAAVASLDRLAAAPPAEACAFRLRIASPRRVYRVLEAGTNLRARWLGLPYGDQGLVVGADAYWSAGGHPPIPLMEDVEVVDALRRSVGIRLLDASVTVSARRWERDGPLRRTFANLSLLLRHRLGARPERLVDAYPREPVRRG